MQLTILLAAMSLFCFCLSVFRFFLTESKVFVFLNWNLFLAFLPWAASSVIMVYEKYRSNKLIVLPVLLFWLLFFPNAPYILTDLFHLRLRHSMPIWFDLTLVLSFAWTGLAFGFASLNDVGQVLRTFMKSHWVNVIIVFLLFLGSFGIYLGRFLRWNSWDIISEPTALFEDIGDRLSNPSEYPGAWGMTLLMGVLLNMMFWSIRLVTKQKQLPLK